MKHIPILFSTAMVQAILEGRKKMTRRTKGLELINLNPDQWTLTQAHKNICRFFSGEENNPNPIEKYWIFEHKVTGDKVEIKCPYGVVRSIKEKSDILWVRESFKQGVNKVFYKADLYHTAKSGWKPSIHMPKEACRIFLRVTDIRCERLHEISQQDAVDEGISHSHERFTDYMRDGGYFVNPINSFHSLWASINGQQSWDDNPYVWVISFERCQRPADFLNIKH